MIDEEAARGLQQFMGNPISEVNWCGLVFSPWVQTSKRLPPLGEEVLFLVGDGHPPTRCVGEYYEVEDKGYFAENREEMTFPVEEVLFWMPIPPNPANNG